MFTLLSLILALNCCPTINSFSDVEIQNAKSNSAVLCELTLRYDRVIWKMNRDKLVYNKNFNVSTQMACLKEQLKTAIACVNEIYKPILPYITNGSIINESELQLILLNKQQLLFQQYGILSCGARICAIQDLKFFGDEVRKMESQGNNVDSMIELLIECDQLYGKLTTFNEYAKKFDIQIYLGEIISNLKPRIELESNRWMAALQDVKSVDELTSKMNDEDSLTLKILPYMLAIYYKEIETACERYRTESQDIFNVELHEEAKGLQDRLVTIAKTVQANDALLKYMFDCSNK